MTDRPSASANTGDSTWATQPASGDWNTAANWNPANVPTDTATLGASSNTAISFAPKSSATVNAIAFAAGAPSYTFTFNAPAPHGPALTIAGEGVSSAAASPQRFVVASSAIDYQQPQLKFMNGATAGGSDIFYSAGPTTPADAGGGVIGFYGTSTAGSASFTVKTGAAAPPEPGTVGGEVSFSDSSSAGNARFTIYGSTSTVRHGDTFGNTVFHDTASAANAVFLNAGGTLSGCDGGNTQFYDNASAGHGLFHNMGGTVSGANGGDVAFDGTSTAADGNFHNFAATASDGYGGVTSFNNNLPALSTVTAGASAGSGVFYNYGAKASGQGGGHTSFAAKYGSPRAATGTFVNYGSAVAGGASTAGHTVFSISLPQQVNYAPSADSGAFWNFPGTAAGAPGGNTEFAVYSDDAAATTSGNVPTAGSATFINLGAVVQGALGGETSFGGTSTADHAELIALGGSSGGAGGTIVFHDQASGGAATVRLSGNGVLDVSTYAQPALTIAALDLTAGIIATRVGTDTTRLVLSAGLTISAAPAAFSFTSGKAFGANVAYTILTAPNLSTFTADQFTGNSVNGAAPTFSIDGNDLRVTFGL